MNSNKHEAQTFVTVEAQTADRHNGPRMPQRVVATLRAESARGVLVITTKRSGARAKVTGGPYQLSYGIASFFI